MDKEEGNHLVYSTHGGHLSNLKIVLDRLLLILSLAFRDVIDYYSS